MTLPISKQIDATEYQNAKKPLFLLDEQIRNHYGLLPKHVYVNIEKIIKLGSMDDLILEEATKRNLLVITHDMRFVLKTITNNQDIVYEDLFGNRYFLSGKNSMLIDKNPRRKTMCWRTKRFNRMLFHAYMTSSNISFYGFYMVNAF